MVSSNNKSNSNKSFYNKKLLNSLIEQKFAIDHKKIWIRIEIWEICQR